MKIREDMRKCVAFVGYQMADGSYRVAGSGFYLANGTPGDGKALVSYFVTARHVIEGIRNLGLDKVFLRVNLNSGEAMWLDSNISQWLFHPTDKSIDVAIVSTGVPDTFDHAILGQDLCLTPEKIAENEVGHGDGVSIIGLFRHHYGAKRNIPIVRTGNIASMEDEKVATKKFGEIDAVLIEARSIGGLSGSPVFLNLGISRQIGGQVMHRTGNGPLFLLLGLMHGHYDVKATEVDSAEQDGVGGLTVEQVNTGIGIVVPVAKINEVIAAHSTPTIKYTVKLEMPLMSSPGQ